MRLKDKVAIVTGAAHGIGQAISRLYAEEGASVLMADIDVEAGQAAAAEIENSGGVVKFQPTDVSSPEEVAEAVRLAGEFSGSIDVLCNNAAYIGDFHDVLGASDEEWDRTYRVTLLGTHYFTREVLPWMMRQNRGSIVNIVSIQGMVGCPTSVSYTTAKAGLLGFTRSAAYDYGRYNVRVNALCPGPIQTRISPKPGEKLYDYQVNNTVLRRVGYTREVAYAALFLASEESSYVTGVTLPVDGGWSSM